MMMKSIPAESPDAYVSALSGWRRTCVEALREAVRAAAALDEVIKWGHLVYFSNGPVLLIRAEDERVLFGFWRGQRLMEIDSRLTAGGKYEMATLELREETPVTFAIARRLAEAAVALNKKLGDPTLDAPSKQSKQKRFASKAAQSKQAQSSQRVTVRKSAGRSLSKSTKKSKSRVKRKAPSRRPTKRGVAVKKK